MKKILVAALSCLMLFQGIFPMQVRAEGEGVAIESPSAILMEASTGTVLYEKAADEKRSPASVTKIMTALLIFEAIEDGKLKLTDEAVTSAHAKSMGGSQVYLEEGEKQTVDTLLKCIMISSGNDAAVTMAEHIGGTEEEFVNRMNQRAQELGMKNTHFVDCCGLTEDPNHYTTARDIAIMSRELVTRFPQIYDYTTVWMENITHVTRQGTKEFGLTNTNKLLRSYEGCKGLKTGSTSIAKYCLSATAVRGGIELISVIMTAPDSKTRFANAAELLNYGFGKCTLYTDKNEEILPDINVKRGTEDTAGCRYEGEFRYLDTAGADLSSVKKEIKLPAELEAPLKKGDSIGEAQYFLNGKMIGTVKLLVDGDVAKAGFLDYLKDIWEAYLW
jgi:D-alanyl-D-alanine carboxypeptidase (penicillin-binding protein 5/6)